MIATHITIISKDLSLSASAHSCQRAWGTNMFLRSRSIELEAAEIVALSHAIHMVTICCSARLRGRVCVRGKKFSGKWTYTLRSRAAPIAVSVHCTLMASFRPAHRQRWRRPQRTKWSFLQLVNRPEPLRRWPCLRASVLVRASVLGKHRCLKTVPPGRVVSEPCSCG